MRKIKVLFVKNGDFELGGVEKFFSNYISLLLNKGYQIDILIFCDNDPNNSNEKINLRTMGVNFFYAPLRTKNILLHFLKVDKLLKNNRYDIIHTHTGASALPTLLHAKLRHNKVLIAHTHGTTQTINNKISLKNIIFTLFKSLMKYVTSDNLACSDEAGISLFGDNYTKINNAIHTKQYVFDINSRIKNRNKLRIADDEIALCTIGRLDDNKNQIHSINLIKNLKNGTKKVKLFIIGTGINEIKLKTFVENNNLSDDVIFLGALYNINEILSTFDIMLMPSFFEGLPMVMVEAQANGLPILASNTISADSKFTDLVTFLDLNDVNEWYKLIQNHNVNYITNKREMYANIVSAEGYDIISNADILDMYYKNKLKEAKI